MKNWIFLGLFTLGSVLAKAQAPAQVNYQGVARNAVGTILANQNIALRLSLRSAAPTGNLLYQETKNLHTNAFGLFNTAIGGQDATNVTGSLDNLDWAASGQLFLQVEIDPAGGNNFINMGTSQLLSVPYSLYARHAQPTGTATGDLAGTYPNPVIANGAIQQNKIADGAVSLNKINPAGASAGQVLAFDGTNIVWTTPTYTNLSAGGDLSGTLPNPVIASKAIVASKIADGAVITSKIADGSVTDNKIDSVSFSKIRNFPLSFQPSGSAGGDLSGSYPNPTIAAGAVTTTKLANGAVTNNTIADGAVTDAKITNVDYSKIMGAPTSFTPSGTAGGDLAGSYPNPSIAPGSVTSAKLGTGAVATTNIIDGAVTNSKITSIDYSKITNAPSSLAPTGTAGGDLTGTYPNPAIANASITSAKLATGAVSTANIVDGAVTNAKITSVDYTKITNTPTTMTPSGTAGGDLTGSFPNPTIAPSSVTSAKLAASAVTTGNIVDGAVTDAKITSVDYSKITNAPTAMAPAGGAGGDLAGTYPAPVIATGSVTSAKLATGAVVSGTIADGAVTNAKIASVDYSKITNAPSTMTPSGTAGGDLTGTFPNPTIAAGTVTSSKLANGAVTTVAITDGAVTNAKITSVDYSKITNAPMALAPTGTAGGDLSGTFPNPTIATGAVTASKISPAGATSGQVLTYNGTNVSWSMPSTAPSGNAGGDLTGTYPNPSINTGAITTTKIADGAITDAKITSVDYSKITNAPTSLSPSGTAGGDLTGTYPSPYIATGVITSNKLSGTGAASGQVLSYNGTNVVWTNPTATPVGNAGGDLTGTYPNPTIMAGAITSTKLATGSVVTTNIADGAVTNTKITSVDYSKITNAPASMTPSGTAGGDLTGTYPNPTIALGAVTTSKINSTGASAGQVISFDGTNVVWSTIGNGKTTGPAGGDLTGIYPNPSINTAAVTTTKIADGAVTDAKITSLAYSKLTGAPTSLTPSGTAGGDLTGTYPNPTIAAGVITNAKLSGNGASSGQVLTFNGANVVWATPATGASGSAGGDLAGTYPNPTIATGAITPAKMNASGATSGQVLTYNGTSVTWSTPSTSPTGSAGGDLTGTYPNPAINSNAVTTSKIADGAVTDAKITSVDYSKITNAPTALTPAGAAGGDLSGTYPNPTIATGTVTSAKLATAAVATSNISDGAVTNAKITSVDYSKITNAPAAMAPTGTAGGDLSGNYPNPTINSNAVTTTKIADGAVTDAKVTSLSYSKLTGAPSSMTPSGTAGGDLSGTYPNPSIATGAVTSSKLSGSGAATGQVLTFNGTNVVWSTPATNPTGNAGGDLSGIYPNPTVASNAITTAKVADGAITTAKINTTGATSGQVLTYNGTGAVWSTPASGGSGSFTVPYAQTYNSSSGLMALTNTGTGTAVTGENSSTNANVTAVIGRISAGASNAIGVHGINNSTTYDGAGVQGDHQGGGAGVLGTSQQGNGVQGSSQNGAGISGYSYNGNAGYFNLDNPGNGNDVISASTNGAGVGVTGYSQSGYGVAGIANDINGAGVAGVHYGGGEGVWGYTVSDVASGVIGQNDGNFAGVEGLNSSGGGTGVLAVASGAGTALEADLNSAANGNTAVFKANGNNVARIDYTGRGFFNGGTQMSGADVAEYFDVTGARTDYEPGDVLIISQDEDRKVEKSATPYSTLVAGVYATRPGVLLTEKNAEQNKLQSMVPMGVVGVIPTKVCLEGGAIKRGDMLVTSSTPGVAMKADPDRVKVGQVIGKALQDYSTAGIGRINVLVSIK